MFIKKPAATHDTHEHDAPVATTEASHVQMKRHLRGLAFDAQLKALQPGGAAGARGHVETDPVALAQRGVSDGGSNLPHAEAIQASFGRHAIHHIRAHQGVQAQAAARQLGASAYATGADVAFASAPNLHTAAHEAAHVVQQQGGVSLKGGMGEAGDRYEQHADQVADRVVAGESAEDLLDSMAGAGGGGGSSVQCDWGTDAHAVQARFDSVQTYGGSYSLEASEPSQAIDVMHENGWSLNQLVSENAHYQYALLTELEDKLYTELLDAAWESSNTPVWAHEAEAIYERIHYTLSYLERAYDSSLAKADAEEFVQIGADAREMCAARDAEVERIYQRAWKNPTAEMVHPQEDKLWSEFHELYRKYGNNQSFIDYYDREYFGREPKTTRDIAKETFLAWLTARGPDLGSGHMEAYNDTRAHEENFERAVKNRSARAADNERILERMQAIQTLIGPERTEILWERDKARLNQK